MARYYEFFEVKVEGTKKNVDSICEAVKGFSDYCDIEKKKNVIRISDLCKIADEKDAEEFAKFVAHAANGANFTMEGSTECSVSGECMAFFVELNNGVLTMRNSVWHYTHSSEWFEDFETYEEYCDECGDDIASEEDFQIAKENDLVYIIDGKVYTEVPFGEAIVIEY